MTEQASKQTAWFAELDAIASSEPTDAAITRCDALLLEARAAGEVRVAVRAQFEKARALSRAGRTKESHDAVTELVGEHERDGDVVVRRLLCRALFGMTRDRIEAGSDRRTAISEYRRILSIADRDPPIQGMAASALYHLALTYAKIALERQSEEHHERAVERFVEVDRRFASIPQPEVQRWVTRAAFGLAALRPLEAAERLYGGVVDRHAQATAPALRVLAAEALCEWGERCAREGDGARVAAVAARARELFGAAERATLGEIGARLDRLGA